MPASSRTPPSRHGRPKHGTWCWLAFPVVLAACAPPRPDPAAVASDRGAEPLPFPDAAGVQPGFVGAYAGAWTPDPAGSCSTLPPVRRDLLVEPSGAASGVNYPLRGSVQPDGSATLAYGGAVLAGRFGPDGFVGRADTGNGCTWRVDMARLAPIGGPPGAATLPAVPPVEDELPVASVRDVLLPDQRLGR